MFNFYNLTHLVKFNKKKLKLYTYTNQIKNFYKTDITSSHSYTMSLTTLFNELNNSIKIEEGTDFKNNTLVKTNLLVEANYTK
jgi:hypothetical protein